MPRPPGFRLIGAFAPRHSQQDTSQELAAVAEHVADERMEAAKIGDGRPSFGLEFEADDRGLDLGPGPKHGGWEDPDDFSMALRSHPDDSAL